MKRTIPFTKTITFRTMIAEVTNIEVSHTLHLNDDYEIEGDILVDGSYKMTDASQIEEEFHYKLPFMIELDDKYDTSDLEIIVGDFYFEIINEEDLKVNVEIELNGLELKKIDSDIITSKISLDNNKLIEELDIQKENLVRNDNFDDVLPIEVEYNEPLDKLVKEIEDEGYEEEKNLNEVLDNNVGSIFSTISATEESFSTYYVYIVRENDTLEYIIDKYKTSRDELLNYNDLSDIKIGTKLIIPCSINE